MPSVPEIAIVTSIPPRTTREQNGFDIGGHYQADCVASWVAAGFKVLSVNIREEIPLLAERYPQIEFVEAPRDARIVAGRPTPLIDDLLLVLARQPQSIVGIINADLCMETGKRWVECIRPLVLSTLLIGHRLDVASWSTQPGELKAQGVPYTGGFRSETGKRWVECIRPLVLSTLLIGHRLDVASWSTQPGELKAQGVPYTGGF